MNIKIYVLQLKSGKLYIGQSTDPKRRFFEHASGKGANICKADRPQEILTVIDLGTDDPKLSCAIENWYSLYIMAGIGASNALGGDYCHEMYRRSNKSWIEIEMDRVYQWIAHLAIKRNQSGIVSLFNNFITWADEYALKFEKHVEM